MDDTGGGWTVDPLDTSSEEVSVRTAVVVMAHVVGHVICGKQPLVSIWRWMWALIRFCSLPPV